MIEGPVTGNIPEVLRHARHRRAAGPRSDALCASGSPGREDDRVTAELAFVWVLYGLS